jgi:hypothetical protein
MHAIRDGKTIETNLRNYIRRTLPVERADPGLTPLVEALFGEHPLAEPPFLEAMPHYKTGATLADLAADGVIHKDTASIFAKAFLDGEDAPAKLKLYWHQEQSVRAVVGGRNLVVCSGTGSGKTECFLIPLVDRLVRLNEASHLKGNGVRAMILYPMNALVNDQVRRLRGILKHYPAIRFGKFTGELASLGDEDEPGVPADATVAAVRAAAAGSEWSGAGFDDEAPLRSEVTTRSQWYKDPAHILVTNYAMLERLLLQPQSSPLFTKGWQFIVLDEAHTYDGSLGTEVAWLVRRLAHRLGDPPDLQYMATSATLISGGSLTEEEKVAKIQDTFASKLFPAPADTFYVQFGREWPFIPPETAHPWPARPPAELYAALRDHPLTATELAELRRLLGELAPVDVTTLLPMTQVVLGAEGWNRKLDKAVALAAAADQPMAAGDLLYLLRQVEANAQAKLIDVDLTAMEVDFLAAGVSLKSVQALVKFCAETVQRLTDRSVWRDWLHDHADPRPSSDPQDKDKKGRRPRIGNRLHVLEGWLKVASYAASTGKLTLDGLQYLLKTAAAMAIAVEREHKIRELDPLSARVQMTPAAAAVITQFTDRRHAMTFALAAARARLTAVWCSQLSAAAGEPCPDGLSIEAAVAWFLGGDPRVAGLANHLQEAAKPVRADGDRTHPAQSTQVAAAVMPEVTDDATRADGLVALIDLASLATPAGTRRPLVDLRYHQLVRGLRDAGVELRSEADGRAVVERLHAEGVVASPVAGDDVGRVVLTLGACRTCGQPFAMGYAPEHDAANAPHPVLLSRMRSEQRPFLHAVAWRKGDKFDEAVEGFPKVDDPSAPWLNTRTGQLKVGVGGGPPSDGWVKGHWYVHGDQRHKEFIGTCPACGEAQRATNNTRFGIITPYAATGGQVRLVLLDELSRAVDPSPDPLARKHAGEGRKVLAFSDSRRGAATLALESQELFAEVTLGRLIPYACRALEADPLDPAIKQVLVDAVAATNPGAKPYWQQMAADAAASRNVEATAAALQYVLAERHCGRLLEVGGASGADLSDHEAAQVRLIAALRRRGRHTIVDRGQVAVSSAGIAHAAKEDAAEWSEAAGADDDMTVEKFGRISAGLVDHLRSRAAAFVPDDWPGELLDPPFAKLVTKGTNDTIKLVSAAATSAANLLVRGVMGWPKGKASQDRAAEVLDAAWPLMTQVANGGKHSPLVPTGKDDECVLEWKDWRITAGGLAANAQNAGGAVGPHEAYDAYLLTREVIPIRIEEHTAQISKEKGAAYQRAFADGRVNVLSCSTTFEMGVDLGELNCVFLANLPPAVANYRQRAGRAGRRPGAAAYVLSFASDAAHDRYFFDRPELLLFGDVQQPLIYLDNSLFRARHLRAEALHQFLLWARSEGRLVADGINPYKDNEPRTIERDWEQAGQFFAGRTAWRAQVDDGRWELRITNVFPPLIDEMPAWRATRGDDVQQYVTGIAGVPADLDYSVADDLYWQVCRQGGGEQGPPLVVPYPLADAGNLVRYRDLAGPNQPKPAEVVADGLRRDDEPTRREVAERYRHQYDNRGNDRLGETAPPSPSGSQQHLLQEQTITWLTRNRVLPKYGFPVDVIHLLPADEDVYGRNVKLERDLKLGLYEYAPGQKVTADKRLFESEKILVFVEGRLQKAVEDAHLIHLCQRCHEVFETEPQDGTCAVCGEGPVVPQKVIQPDAFQAKPSRAGAGGVRPPPGVPRHLLVGGYRRPPRPVDNTGLRVAESYSGELRYLNFGPGYRGFGHGAERFGLTHVVKTDIAVWVPDYRLFETGGPIGELGAIDPKRKDHALRSALEAIVRAAARVLEVQDRDIGGLLHPDRQLQGWFGFVLFDESAGGGGAVLPLVLTGDPAVDPGRSAKIRQILDVARALCVNCTTCGRVHPAGPVDLDLIPVSREEYLADPAGQATRRPRQACYDCLKSYRNQRVHDWLDRWEAVAVLDGLRAARPAAPPAGAGPGAGVQDGMAYPGLPAGRQPHYAPIAAEETIVSQGMYVLRQDDGYQVVRLADRGGGWRAEPASVDDWFDPFEIPAADRHRVAARVVG